jgi:hypothetical protein
MTRYRLAHQGGLACLLCTAWSISCAADFVAQVKEPPTGPCESCPYNHFEKSTVLVKDKLLKATDEVRCLGTAQATVHFLAKDGGDFVVHGANWRVVGFAGLPTPSNKLTPLFGYEAQNFSFDRVEPQTPPAQTIVTTLFPFGTSDDIPRFAEQNRTGVTEQIPVPLKEDFVQASVADLGLSFGAYYKAYTHAQDDKVQYEVSQLLGSRFPSGDFMVQSKSGTVTLKGIVQEPDQKHKAGEVAKGVAGVEAVYNRLQVRE